MKVLMTIIVTSCLLLAFSCKNEVDTINRTTEDAITNIKEETSDWSEEIEEDFEEMSASIDDKIRDIKEDLDDADEAAKDEYEDQLEMLERRQTELNHKWTSWKNDTHDDLVKAKADISEWFEEVRTEIDQS